MTLLAFQNRKWPATGGGNPELLNDPGWDNAAAWGFGAGVNVTGSKLVVSSPAQFSGISSNANFWAPISSPGTLHRWEIVFDSVTSGGSIRFRTSYYLGPTTGSGAAGPPDTETHPGGASTEPVTATGTKSFTFTPPSNTTHIQVQLQFMSTGIVLESPSMSLKKV